MTGKRKVQPPSRQPFRDALAAKRAAEAAEHREEVETKIKLELPQQFGCLLEPHRYKIFSGGRGSGKSWSLARALLLFGTMQPLRVVCAREIQESIRQSVYALLRDQIVALGMQSYYQVLASEIRGPMQAGGLPGTEFTFHGLRHNVDNIKSLEGADIVWVEEAQTVSNLSWEKLIPTVRKPGSEIWMSFNPELESDPTYKRFILSPPPNSVVKHVTWRDNPWWTPELEQERITLLERDPDAYQHVYEGRCIRHLEGTIYAKELREAELRITRVPYDMGKGVGVWADLGWGDMTSLIFVQRIGMEYRVLKSYQNRHQLWQHYLLEIQKSGFVIEGIWLPHDAENGSLAGKSVADQTRSAGYNVAIVLRETNAAQIGIDAARMVFPRCWFDEVGCADLLYALRHYRYAVDEHGNYGKKPAHDEHSHFADAFRYFAVTHDSRIRMIAPTDTLNKLERARTQQAIMIGRHGSAGLGWMRR